jgi:hypothetical protein
MSVGLMFGGAEAPVMLLRLPRNEWHVLELVKETLGSRPIGISGPSRLAPRYVEMVMAGLPNQK